MGSSQSRRDEGKWTGVGTAWSRAVSYGPGSRGQGAGRGEAKGWQGSDGRRTDVVGVGRADAALGCAALTAHTPRQQGLARPHWDVTCRFPLHLCH